MLFILFMLYSLASFYYNLNFIINNHYGVLICPFPPWVSFISSKIISHSVVSNSLRPHRLKLARLLYPWNSPEKNPVVESPSLKGILQEMAHFSSGSREPSDWIWVSFIAGRFFTTEPPAKSLLSSDVNVNIICIY